MARRYRCRIQNCAACTKRKTPCKLCTRKYPSICWIHQKMLSKYRPPKAVSNVLYDQLRVIDDMFVQHKIPYWVDYGTLLGAIRHKGLVPHDDDNDICVPAQSRKSVEKLQRAFKKLGYTLDISNNKQFQLGNIMLPGAMVDSPATDIFFVFKSRNGHLPLPDQRKKFAVGRLKRVPFGNFTLSAPSNSVTILNNLYPGWRKNIVIDSWHVQALGHRDKVNVKLHRNVNELHTVKSPKRNEGGQRPP